MHFPQHMPIDDELITSGDGKSPVTAIRFRPCHVQTRVARERQFILERFGVEDVDWSEMMHFTSSDLQSVWSIELKDGTRTHVYFDTSTTIYDEQ
jgi:hypothetical protein